mmetsp:Transcript_20809/g.64310  ORF Transcript_20809/g.64310 Transcript_20809/m.64310 type:complete len:585 (+) Transcript_20809:174-1928(+)
MPKVGVLTNLSLPPPRRRRGSKSRPDLKRPGTMPAPYRPDSFFAIEEMHCSPTHRQQQSASAKKRLLQRWRSFALSTPMSNPVAHFQFLSAGHRERHLTPVSQTIFYEMLRFDEEVGKAVSENYASLAREGKLFELVFNDRKLGFTVVLARLANSPRPRLLVEETFVTSPAFHVLMPTDELVAINGSLLIPIDMEAFPALVSQLQHIDRPLRLTFAKTAGRHPAFRKQQTRRDSNASSNASTLSEHTSLTRGPPSGGPGCIHPAAGAVPIVAALSQGGASGRRDDDDDDEDEKKTVEDDPSLDFDDRGSEEYKEEPLENDRAHHRPRALSLGVIADRPFADDDDDDEAKQRDVVLNQVEREEDVSELSAASLATKAAFPYVHDDDDSDAAQRPSSLVSSDQQRQRDDESETPLVEATAVHVAEDGGHDEYKKVLSQERLEVDYDDLLPSPRRDATAGRTVSSASCDTGRTSSVHGGFFPESPPPTPGGTLSITDVHEAKPAPNCVSPIRQPKKKKKTRPQNDEDQVSCGCAVFDLDEATCGVSCVCLDSYSACSGRDLDQDDAPTSPEPLREAIIGKPTSKRAY